MKRFHVILPLLWVVSCTDRGESPPSPQWGEPGFDIGPMIESTPSVSAAKATTSAYLHLWKTLSDDRTYYIVRVGRDLPDRFDVWFVLKVTKEGRVFRLHDDPETEEDMWVPDRAPGGR